MYVHMFEWAGGKWKGEEAHNHFYRFIAYAHVGGAY